MLCKDTFSGFTVVSYRAREMGSSSHSHGASSTSVDQKIADRVATSLTHAACEWLLIFLMFVHALLSYLLVWFARYCRLQLPCFLCSRLHRPLRWRFLLCRSHRSEVSSLISCQIHDNKLADSRGMCDDCLLSFTKKSGPNPDMHRLLLGKLGYDLLLKSDSAHPKSCSCCDKPWRSRHSSQRLIQLGLPGRNTVSKPNIPTPRTLSRRGSGNLKKMRDQKAPVVVSGFVRDRGNGMDHVGYTELKITSDAESEFPFSDDDAFIPVTDFNIESFNRSRHESLSEGSFGSRISDHKQPDFRDDKKKNIQVEAPMVEFVHLDDVPQQPVQADKNATIFCEFINPVDACPSSSSVVQEDNAGTVPQTDTGATASKNSCAFYGRILDTHSTMDTSYGSHQGAKKCPAGDIDASSGEGQNQAHDSASFSQEVSNSAVRPEGCEKVVEPKESDFVVEHDGSNSSAKEHCGIEKDEVTGASEPLTSKDDSVSSAKDGVNGDAVEQEQTSIGEDVFKGDSETLTSISVSGSVLKECTGNGENGFKGDSETLSSNNASTSVPKVNSGSGEDGIKGGAETLTSKDVSDSVPKVDSGNGEDGFNRDSETLISNDVSSSVTGKDSGNGEDALNGDSETLTSNNVSGSVSKEHSVKDEKGTKGDSEPLTSRDIPSEELSVDHGDTESSNVTEAHSTPNETPVLKHSPSVESFVSVNNDFEVENLVDRLKQQVEYDKKCLKDLQKELEEERNASDIAANQAMAMITRLQEEKAALHMEALQYLRMMDEQAEHDVEALEKANDLLAEKEKEIQDLEMELEYYRLKYPDELSYEIIAAMGIAAQKETSATSTTDENKDNSPKGTKDSHKSSFSNPSSLEIEKERLHISQRLRNLEKKLYHFAQGRLPECAENGRCDDREVVTSNGSLKTKEKSLEHEDSVPTVNGEALGEENNFREPNMECDSLPKETTHRSLSQQDKNEWITMENEISELKKRLETLKADREFLEHAFVTIEKGKGGVELIEAIARELRELRNLGIRRR